MGPRRTGVNEIQQKNPRHVRVLLHHKGNSFLHFLYNILLGETAYYKI